jgi:hypothetical protein
MIHGDATAYTTAPLLDTLFALLFKFTKGRFSYLF